MMLDAPVSVVSLYQKQETIYPRAVSGWFAGWRWALVWATQIVFYGLPWLEWNARQAMLFDLVSRRFYIFGLVLYPQDFIYLTAVLIISAYALFLFTAVAGRLWCGFACPQTVYTEIFLWIERRIEGDRGARMKRDRGPWSVDKTWRKAIKHTVWLAIGLWSGFTLVGYFTPIRSLAAQLAPFGFGPWEAFWILFYGFATYGNAGWLREQVCKYMCPYARFQSAMFDKDTLIITYDAGRGEPRGSRPRNTDPKTRGLGDCVDCSLCVQVCPTGIDIRRGLQYECIGCASCIDVCNTVMDKVGSPHGLIRYTTQNALAHGLSGRDILKRTLRPRVLVYSAILILIVCALLASLSLRSPFKVDVVRDRGSLARLVGEGDVENVYRLQIMNATESVQRYRVSIHGIQSAQVKGATEVTLDSAQARWVGMAVRVDRAAAAALGPGSHPVQFHIELLQPAQAPTGPMVQEKSTFIVPR